MCHLRIMNTYEFEHYIKKAILEYAHDLEISGSYPKEEANKASNKAFDTLLPDGLDTKDQYIYHIINDTDAIVGMIWYGLRNHDECFIYDFSVVEIFRGLGYGEQGLELVEAEAKTRGVKKIGLHVFGHNAAAIGLYKKMGYNIYSMNMSKEIK